MIAQSSSLFFSLSLLSTIAPIGLILLALVVVANRPDADPTGRRGYGIYLLAVTFIALFVTLFALYAGVQSGLRAAFPEKVQSVGVGTDVQENGNCTSNSDGSVICEGGSVPIPPESSPFVTGPDTRREDGAGAIQAAIVALAGFLLFRFHARPARALVDDPDYAQGSGRRSHEGYLYTTAFASVSVVVVAGVLAGNGLLRAAFQDTFQFGSGAASAGMRSFVANTLLAGAGMVIFLFHWRRAAALRAVAKPPPPAEPPPAAPRKPAARKPAARKPAARKASPSRRGGA